MLSQRHTRIAAADGAARPPRERSASREELLSREESPERLSPVDADGARVPANVLDATRDAVLAVGVRRTTLTDVARRAGVSRMTVYRQVADVETLVLAMLTREFGNLLIRVERATSRRRTARARLVASVLTVIDELPRDPVFARILDVDPELLLPFVTDRFGSTQLMALGHLRRAIVEGQADGSIRRGDADALAATVLLAMTPFVLSSRLIAATGDREAIHREFTTMIDRLLAP